MGLRKVNLRVFSARMRYLSPASPPDTVHSLRSLDSSAPPNGGLSPASPHLWELVLCVVVCESGQEVSSTGVRARQCGMKPAVWFLVEMVHWFLPPQLHGASAQPSGVTRPTFSFQRGGKKLSTRQEKKKKEKSHSWEAHQGLPRTKSFSSSATLQSVHSQLHIHRFAKCFFFFLNQECGA